MLSHKIQKISQGYSKYYQMMYDGLWALDNKQWLLQLLEIPLVCSGGEITNWSKTDEIKKVLELKVG